jgi:3-oxoacyl-[acyl-carrier-protein] synthase II
MRALAITGLGVITPIGDRPDAILESLKNGLMADMPCFAIKDFSFSEYLDDRRFRRAASVSQYALAAAALATAERECEDISGDNSSIVMAISHGALNYTQKFHETLVQEGPEAISPIHFSDSVLNAPAGNASICFGITGPVHTIIGGPEASIKSVMKAAGMIMRKQTDRSLVIAAEELNELSIYCYSRFGIKPLSEGAGAILIEREDDIRESDAYCFISGMASVCDPANPHNALNSAIDDCINKSGLNVTDIDLVTTAIEDLSKSRLWNLPRTSITVMTGNAFAASMVWDIALSAAAIRNGELSAECITNGRLGPARNIIVCCSDSRGNAAALLLTKKPLPAEGHLING